MTSKKPAVSSSDQFTLTGSTVTTLQASLGTFHMGARIEGDSITVELRRVPKAGKKRAVSTIATDEFDALTKFVAAVNQKVNP